MNIKKNVILAPYTTFRIGGPARYFCEVGSVDDLKDALQFSKENNLPLFILGGGSNVLVSDKGFDGLVIKMEIKGLEFNGELLNAGAGENWDDVVGKAVAEDLGGIENLSFIPGTVGGAVYQNIGAYGVELKDVLKSLEAVDARSREIKTFSNSDCRFGYRDSVFKTKEKGNFIILRVNLELSKNREPKIDYPDLVKIFGGKQPTILEVRNAVIRIRQNKLPYPHEAGNAGSFFKNPIVPISNYQLLISKYSDLKGRDLGNGSVKLSAAQFIEKCGWKGKAYGNIGVSEKHSLVLVNYGNGTAEEIINLAEKIKKAVKTEFGVVLEPEVEGI
ncbi:MAG: UDP-N-acetylmuramate dehydrogenase [Candidatus Yanofskybacteria bacterium]|nr:UDP-N-acetylmuramate dehydrogenase [Candidatus Yanofskybacteria bacterium]